jgi:hypothetical protein
MNALAARQHSKGLKADIGEVEVDISRGLLYVIETEAFVRIEPEWRFRVSRPWRPCPGASRESSHGGRGRRR